MTRNLGWVLATAVSLAGIGAASAADMAVKARPLPPPVYSWTGCYIGLSAGGKGVRTRDTVYIPAAPPIAASSIFLGELEDTTWIAGGQAGCNYQSGNWVFGIEATRMPRNGLPPAFSLVRCSPLCSRPVTHLNSTATGRPRRVLAAATPWIAPCFT
jgi:hypothetical protein